MSQEQSVYKEVRDLHNFVLGLVHKDQSAADAAETAVTAQMGDAYVDAVLQRDNLSPAERQQLIESFSEGNIYYAALAGNHGIPSHVSRPAADGDVLYYPPGLLSAERTGAFLKEYELARRYFDNTMRTRAWEDAPLYSGWARLTTVLMAMIRYTDLVLTRPRDVDLMNEWQLRQLFASYGLGDYGSLPLKYQRRLVKNLSRLLRKNGTSGAIIDLVGLFGFEDVQVFRHYLYRTWPEQGGEPDYTADPEVMTLRVPYGSGDLEEVLATGDYQVEPLARLVDGDPYWRAEEAEVAALDFNLAQSKYISVGTVMSILRRSLEVSYARSLIERAADVLKDQNLFLVNLAVSPDPINLADAVTAAHVLASRVIGVPDAVPVGAALTMKYYRYGYDELADEVMDTPLGPLPNVVDPGDRAAPSGVEEFVVWYKQNQAYREAFEKKLATTQDYYEYKRLRELYEVRLLTEYGEARYAPHATFTAYLASRDPALAAWVDAGDNTRAGYQAKLLELSSSIDNYVGNGDLSLDPVGTYDAALFDYIQRYIRRLALIFKSYTCELASFSAGYVLEAGRFHASVHWRHKLAEEVEDKDRDHLDLSDELGGTAYLPLASGLPLNDGFQGVVEYPTADGTYLADGSIVAG